MALKLTDELKDAIIDVYLDRVRFSNGILTGSFIGYNRCGKPVHWESAYTLRTMWDNGLIDIETDGILAVTGHRVRLTDLGMRYLSYIDNDRIVRAINP